MIDIERLASVVKDFAQINDKKSYKRAYSEILTAAESFAELCKKADKSEKSKGFKR